MHWKREFSLFEDEKGRMGWGQVRLVDKRGRFSLKLKTSDTEGEINREINGERESKGGKGRTYEGQRELE